MVSAFIEEKDGYLALSDEFQVTNNDQDIDKSALAVLQMGEHREGYWNSDRFMEQAVKIADEVSTITKATITSGALTTAAATLHLLKMLSR